MLVIRKKQWDLMADGRVEQCKQELRAMVFQYWPLEAAALGAEGVRVLVERAYQACAKRKIEAQKDLAAYVNIMLALGPDFESDARYPWAKRVLDDTALRPAARVQRLAALVSEHLALSEGEPE